MPSGEVSAINPAAVRGPNGFWNEATLPVVDWEVPAQRKVIPESIQHHIQHDSSVVRVSKDIDRKQRSKHADIAKLYDAFNLESWGFMRRVSDERGVKWEFVCLVDEASYCPWPLMAVLGIDDNGSLNLVSSKKQAMDEKVTGWRVGFCEKEKNDLCPVRNFRGLLPASGSNSPATEVISLSNIACSSIRAANDKFCWLQGGLFGLGDLDLHHRWGGAPDVSRVLLQPA